MISNRIVLFKKVLISSLIALISLNVYWYMNSSNEKSNVVGHFDKYKGKYQSQTNIKHSLSSGVNKDNNTYFMYSDLVFKDILRDKTSVIKGQNISFLGKQFVKEQDVYIKANKSKIPEHSSAIYFDEHVQVGIANTLFLNSDNLIYDINEQGLIITGKYNLFYENMHHVTGKGYFTYNFKQQHLHTTGKTQLTLAYQTNKEYQKELATLGKAVNNKITLYNNSNQE